MENAKIEVKTQGDHHKAELSIDPKTGQVASGAVFNYSTSAMARLKLGTTGVEGSFSHSGDDHALTLQLDKDGRFSGSYRDSVGKGLELKIEAGQINLVKGTLPKSGSLTLKGGHHSLELKLDDKGTLSGAIRSKLTKDGSFDLKIEGGKVSGAVAHTGKNHEMKVELSKDGWKGEVSLKKGSTIIQIGVTGGRSGALSSAQISAAKSF